MDALELAQSNHLKFSTNLEDLLAYNYFMVTVPTPISEHKRPDLMPLIQASQNIGQELKLSDIVVYESLVYPGCKEEKISELVFNKDFLLAIAQSWLISGIENIVSLVLKKLPQDLLKS